MAANKGSDASTEVKAFLFVDHTRLLQTALSKYFNKPLFSDITVIGPDGRKLLCHQVILSAGSKRFANMLEQGNLANEELPVWGVDSDALQSIIEFFYSGQCNLTFPNAVAVMDAANRLDVPSLSGAANTYVREALSVQTASTILTHALQFKLSELSNTCLSLINENFAEVTECKDFTQASFDCLKRILTHMQETKTVSEEDLFRAAWKWTLSEPSRSNMFDSCLKIVPIPSNLSIKELIDQSNPQGAGGMAAVAALMQAAAAAGNNSQQQREASEPTRSEPGETGTREGSQLPSQQQRGGSTALQSAGKGGLSVEVGSAVIKEEKGVNGASSAPQGTLSSFDPMSGQPTPTSKALTGPVDGAAFGAGGGPGEIAAAAAAAAAGLEAMEAQQYAAAYGGGASSAQGAGGSAGAPDGSASGAEGGAPGSPGKMGNWGGPMGMQMQGPMGMQGMGVPGMPPGFGMPGMPMMGPMMGPMGPHMMGMGGMSGYGMPSGRNHAKGVCQVEGCNADLRGLRDYHLRYKICEYHLKVSSIMRDGVPQRFCQQCGRFHPLQDFDGAKRSCRARLLRHNARRRKRGEEELQAMGYGSQQSAMKRGRGSFSQMPDMDDPSAAAAAAGGYWPMMGNMDPYMAMAMGGMAGYNPDGSFNPAMMQQYAQFGMVSPTGGAMPNASDATGGAAAAEAAEGAGAAGGSSAAPSGGKRGGSASKGAKGAAGASGASDADWAEGEGEGAQDEGRERDEVAWAAAGLEMLADVAQARSSAAGDRSRAGSDAGSKPAADATAQQQQQQGQPAAAGVAAATNPCSVAPLQLADSPSPHANAGGLFVGRVSPGHDAPPTEPGADDATAAAAAAGKGARTGTPGAAGAASGGAAAAGGAGDTRQRAAGAAAGGASSSPSNDLGFRADKPGVAAGTVKG